MNHKAKEGFFSFQRVKPSLPFWCKQLSKNEERLRIESQQLGCGIITSISFSKEQMTVWKRNVET